MFCVNCGTELAENSSYCFNCGQDLSKHQQELSLLDKEPENNTNSGEYEELDMNEDSDVKIQNLTDIISKLQDENKRLKEELEKYTSPKPKTPRRSEFGRKKMPKPKEEGMFTKFKKWYNE